MRTSSRSAMVSNNSDLSKEFFKYSRYMFTTLIPFMLFANMLIHAEIERNIRRSCFQEERLLVTNSSDESFLASVGQQTALDLLAGEIYCKAERKALTVFACFLLVRLASYEFERIFLLSCQHCAIRKLISGHRIGIGPGIVFFARELLWPFAAEANYVVLASTYTVVVIASALMIYPYFQDLYNVNESLKVAKRSDRFADGRFSLWMTHSAMLVYALIVVLIFSGSVMKRVADYLNVCGGHFNRPQRPNAVWPWFFSAIPLIALSTAYAVLWWSGDVFGVQLTMSVAEFVMSLAVNSLQAVSRLSTL
ncbi:unnamed protein product [Anisakis simplex]|uniref:Transmembrane protein n=1 Tax=Anisakis simplex TaxID=6269 RepID=A0A158PPS3_ANISI|nr:unnamed protein product [Anisakis simplex]